VTPYLNGLAEQAVGSGPLGPVRPRPLHAFEQRSASLARLDEEVALGPVTFPAGPGPSVAPRDQETPLPGRPEPPAATPLPRVQTPPPRVQAAEAGRSRPTSGPPTPAVALSPGQPPAPTVRPTVPRPTRSEAPPAVQAPPRPEAPTTPGLLLPRPRSPALDAPAPQAARPGTAVHRPPPGIRPLPQAGTRPDAPAPQPPSVEITIGRLEVRLSPTTAGPAARPAPAAPATLSLEQYLRGRDGGGR
jgi:hypothetical protein